MDPNIHFMTLGGGQNVGNSCYFLKIGNNNILLDAGCKRVGDIKIEPDFYSLLTSPFIESMNEINQVFISHAHQDHMGYLVELLKQCTNCNVYMTEITKALCEYQLAEKMGGNEEYRDQVHQLFSRITTVTYMQKIDFGNYKVTFYPAGHIPGAMMILFETKSRRILYTGDYSLHETLLTSGCVIPSDKKIDTLLLCGLHAKHPYYRKVNDELFKKTSMILNQVRRNHCSIICQVPQLSKGIEFVKLLNSLNYTGIPIYIDESILKVIHKMEQLNIPILNQYNKLSSDEYCYEPHIYVTSRNYQNYSYDQKINIDFTLHEDFEDMKYFIKEINAREVIVVHCSKEHSKHDHTIEQEIMNDGNCRSQFIFAEDKEIYQI